MIVIPSYVGCIGTPQSTNTYLHNLRSQAEKGDPEAQYRYGWRCQVGWGVKENKIEALWWYRQASQKNHPVAIFRLGEFYRDGVAVKADLVESYKWFLVAVEAGGLEQSRMALRELAPRLKPQEIKAAKERADEWMLKFQKPKKSG